MPITYSTARTAHTGTWRSTEYAGKSFFLILNNQCADRTRRDAFTTSGDFIISPHAAAKGLYVATCGNFHGWKFFPVLGKYVVKMMEDDLAPELVTKWAWDRERPDASLFADFPRHEMSDLADERARL